MDTPNIEAIVQVGKGRGFFLDTERVDGNVIVTAAHCLPHLPPCNVAHDTELFIYEGLVGMLGGDMKVPTQCLFVDPVGDIAVLGEPNDLELPKGKTSEEYDLLMRERPALRLDFSNSWMPAPGRSVAEGPVWLLDTEGQWVNGTARAFPSGQVKLSGSALIGKPGVSGSPVLDENGLVLGLVTNGVPEAGWMMADAFVLKNRLPGWLLACARGETDATSAP